MKKDQSGLSIRALAVLLSSKKPSNNYQTNPWSSSAIQHVAHTAHDQLEKSPIHIKWCNFTREKH